MHSALNYKQKCEIFRKSHRLLPKDKTNAFGDFFELSGPGGSSEDFFFFKIPTYLVLALPLHDFFTFKTSKYILT